MSFRHYAELRSASTGSKITTLWNHAASATYVNAGYGPQWMAGQAAVDPVAAAVATAIGEAGSTPAGDSAWWASLPGAETAAGLFVSSVEGLGGDGVSSRGVLSAVNGDGGTVTRRAASARVITIRGQLLGADEASVSRMRSELGRILDPAGQVSATPDEDLELWWPEICEAGDSCVTKPGNCTGAHWRYVRKVTLVDGASLSQTRQLRRGPNVDGAVSEIRMRLVATDPRIYIEPPAASTLDLDGAGSETIPAEPTCGTVAVNIDLPKEALQIRLNPDRTFCEIGWDIATRVVSESYIEVGDLEPVYVPPTSPEPPTPPYGIRVFWNQYEEALSAGTGKTWEKINPSRWPADGSFPTDAPIEIQQLRVWVPGREEPRVPDEPVAPYQVHLFWEPNSFDSTRGAFVWEPINDQRWPGNSGGDRPMPTDADVEIGLVTYPNPDYDSGEPESFENPKWRTINAPRGSEPYQVRLLQRSTGSLHGTARAVNWTLPNFGSTGTETTTDITHIVVSGDTLSGIASTYGTTVGAIQTANPWLADPNVINVGWEITIPDQTVEEDTSAFEVNFPPPLARFEVFGTENQYNGGGYFDPGNGVSIGLRGRTVAQVQAENRQNAAFGEWVAEANRGGEFFDIVLTQNGMWAEANSSWDVSVFGVPPDGGALRVLPDFNLDVVETDPTAVDPYECPVLDPELDITIDTGARTWEPSGWIFDGEWPEDSILVIPAETPGTYSESVNVHDPNCVTCGPDPAVDVATLFGDSIYIADPPLALADVASGVTYGTPVTPALQSWVTLGSDDVEDPVDFVITIRPEGQALENFRVMLIPNPNEVDPNTFTADERCAAYRFRFATGLSSTSTELIMDTGDRSIIADVGNGVTRDGSALVSGEDGGRPVWPDYMAGKWSVVVECDPANTGALAAVDVQARIAEPIV